MTNQYKEKVVKTLFGSHLYGLSTPESDKDYKGIFIPNHDDLLLGRAKNNINLGTGDDETKNTKDDVDFEMYSLAYFIKLACKGETVALDMLHGDESFTLETSETWKELVGMREQFYTKNMNAYLGYVKKQAAKYGIKGSRLADIKLVIDYLKTWEGMSHTLSEAAIWDTLPEGEYISTEKTKHPDGKEQNFLVVNKKMYQDTSRVESVLEQLQKMYDGYGARAKAAEKNEGVDWKAMSHALRVGYQMQSIFKHGGFSYPLDETDYILSVKNGNETFKTVSRELEVIVELCEGLAEKSAFREKVDTDAMDQWVLNKYKEAFNVS